MINACSENLYANLLHTVNTWLLHEHAWQSIACAHASDLEWSDWAKASQMHVAAVASYLLSYYSFHHNFIFYFTGKLLILYLIVHSSLL